MNFIILADKYHKGMKSKGCLGLLSLNQRYNVFEFQYKNIRKSFPESKIIYVYGFDRKKMENFFGSSNKFTDLITIYNYNYESYNYVYSLRQAIDYLQGCCFITFGDVVFKHTIFEKFNVNNGSQIFINQKMKNQLGCTIVDNAVKNISFELGNYLSNLYYIHEQDVSNLSRMVDKNKYRNYFLFELINNMIENNNSFSPFIKNNKSIMCPLKEIKANA